MKNKNSNKKNEHNTPFIPKPPDSKEDTEQDKNDTSPNSDPNYGYFPSVAYPIIGLENEEEE
jgi:hypothetical protein